MMTQTQAQTAPGHVLTLNGLAVDAPLFSQYRRHPAAWDELFDEATLPHPHCRQLLDRLGQLATSEFHKRRSSADLVFINQGITFSVYADRRGVEKIFPFDLKIGRAHV